MHPNLLPMIRVFLVMLCCGIISLSTIAQFDELNEPPKVRKNSIGLYGTAPLSTLMGGFPNSPRLGIIYRRQSATRPGRLTRVQVVVDFYDVLDPSDQFLTEITLVTDTSLVYRYTNNSETRVTGRIGWEWSDPEERHTPIYGVDLIFGTNTRLDQIASVAFARDTLVNEVRPLASDPGDTVFTRDQTHTQYLVGAAFTVGYRFRVDDTWDFIFQLSPEFYYSPYEDVKSRISRGFQEDSPASNFWLQVRLVEFQMAWRF